MNEKNDSIKRIMDLIATKGFDLTKTNFIDEIEVVDVYFTLSSDPFKYIHVKLEGRLTVHKKSIHFSIWSFKEHRNGAYTLVSANDVNESMRVQRWETKVEHEVIFELVERVLQGDSITLCILKKEDPNMYFDVPYYSISYDAFRSITFEEANAIFGMYSDPDLIEECNCFVLSEEDE